MLDCGVGLGRVHLYLHHCYITVTVGFEAESGGRFSKQEPKTTLKNFGFSVEY